MFCRHLIISIARTTIDFSCTPVVGSLYRFVASKQKNNPISRARQLSENLAGASVGQRLVMWQFTKSKTKDLMNDQPDIVVLGFAPCGSALSFLSTSIKALGFAQAEKVRSVDGKIGICHGMDFVLANVTSWRYFLAL